MLKDIFDTYFVTLLTWTPFVVVFIAMGVYVQVAFTLWYDPRYWNQH